MPCAATCAHSSMDRVPLSEGDDVSSILTGRTIAKQTPSGVCFAMYVIRWGENFEVEIGTISKPHPFRF